MYSSGALGTRTKGPPGTPPPDQGNQRTAVRRSSRDRWLARRGNRVSMTRSESSTRRPLGLLLCAVILGANVATPLLERGGFLAHAAIESEHDPATCAHPHDHRICTQVGANLSLGSRTQDHRVAHAFLDAAPTSAPLTASDRPLREGPPSRAPPQV